jgi:endoglucanase
MKLIKLILILVFSALLVSLPVRAELLSLKRGLPVDLWLSWPQTQDLTQAKFVDVFPEVRRVLKGDEFKRARAAGFDFVRLPIDPAAFIANTDDASRAKLIGGVRSLIDDILAADMKVVVDLHSIPRFEANALGTDQVLASEALFAKYLEAVSFVGRGIAEYPADKVGFEPMNEPTNDCNWENKAGYVDQWPAQMIRMHKAARDAAPKLTLVFSGACWGGADGLVKIDPSSLKDDNVIWSFHFYEPHIFTHQSATWTQWYNGHVKGLKFPPDTTQKRSILRETQKGIRASDAKADAKEFMLKQSAIDIEQYFDGNSVERARKVFDDVAKWAKMHSIAPTRLYVGEFGVVKPDDVTKDHLNSRHAFYRFARSEAEKRGYTWVVWSWSGSMGIANSFDGYDFNAGALKALGLEQ